MHYYINPNCCDTKKVTIAYITELTFIIFFGTFVRKDLTSQIITGFGGVSIINIYEDVREYPRNIDIKNVKLMWIGDNINK